MAWGGGGKEDNLLDSKFHRQFRTLLVMCAVLILLKGIYAEFQVIRGFSQKIPADLLSYDKIHS